MRGKLLAGRPGRTQQCTPTRPGFALAEALLALVLLGLASSTLLMSLTSSLQAGIEAADQVLAEGLAAELMEEIRRLPYKEKGGVWNQPVLGPEPDEASRVDFDDVDDYHNWISAPPSDRWGNSIGTGDGSGGKRAIQLQHVPVRLAPWRTRSLVRYVEENDHTVASPVPTRFRRIDVFVEHPVDGTWHALAHMTEVVAYAPGAAS